MEHCLINQTACGRIQGDPVCPKCGLDERVVYPGEADREAAQTAGRARYWEAHARQLEAAQSARESAKVSEPVVIEQAPLLPTTPVKLNPQAAWFTTQVPAVVPAPAGLELVHNEELREKTIKRIRRAWIVAAVSSCFSLIFFNLLVWLQVNWSSVMRMDPFFRQVTDFIFALAFPLLGAMLGLNRFLDTALVGVLAYGVYRKSRLMSLLLLFYVLGRWLYFLLTPVFVSELALLLGALIAGICFMGMWACFTWHKRFA